MFNLDEELIPVRCPNARCAAEFAKSVRSLKAGTELRCIACDRLIEYDAQELSRRVEQAEKSVNDVLRSVISVKGTQ